MPKSTTPVPHKLIKVDGAGYWLSTGSGKKYKVTLVPHEALVAILTGLIVDEDRQAEADADPSPPFVNPSNVEALKDAAQYARRQLAAVAWRFGTCSWNNQFQAIDRDANPFHQSD